MPIFDALVDSRIKLIATRHEQGATHMADGYSRATGKPGVVLVTSGPGATNTITGLAHCDDGLGSDDRALWSANLHPMLGQGCVPGGRCHGPHLRRGQAQLPRQAMPAEIPRIVMEAFYLATSGRPGPSPDRPAQGYHPGSATRPSSTRTKSICPDIGYPPGATPEMPSKRPPSCSDLVQAAGALRGARRGHLRGRQDDHESGRKAALPDRQHACWARARPTKPTRSTSACSECTVRPMRTKPWTSAT